LEYSVDEDEIDSQCDALRQDLLAKLKKGESAGGSARRGLKMHQVHELADAKLKESERLRAALKISKDYEEGGHWKRQEERMRKAAEREKEEEKVEREQDDYRGRDSD
jgi:hypothetical protein